MSVPIKERLTITRPDPQVMWIRTYGMKAGYRFRLMILPDLHLDNNKSVRSLIKKHLDYAVEHQIPVILLGDIFDIMGAKSDKRQNSTDIYSGVLNWRPKLPNGKRNEDYHGPYFEKVVGFVSEFLEPYKDVIIGLLYGNHETAITKHNEIDVLRMLATSLGLDPELHLLPYQSYLRVFFRQYKDGGSQGHIQRTIGMHHGYGGGGVKTKGILPLGRTHDHIGIHLDALIMGHFHEGLETRHRSTHMDKKGRLEVKETMLIIAGCYKDEGRGGMGFHTERGRPPKPLGGALLEWEYFQKEGEPMNFLFRSYHLSDMAPMPR